MVGELMGNGRCGSVVVGIDLGTTLSAVSHLDPAGVLTTVTNRDGEPLTPSVVYLDGNAAIVGKAAKKAASHFPDKVATVIKRDMGLPVYGRKLNGAQFRPETLSAIILRKLKQDAERRIGPISAAVITVPAFFDDTRRKATEDAGKIAGLEVLDIINEPTAAAIAYSFEGRLSAGGAEAARYFAGGQQTVLVYDLGGGTFDVTIVQLSAQRFRVLATDGAVELGGKDWDERIVDFLGAEFARQYGVNPLSADDSGPETRRARFAAGMRAEATKELLSDLPVAPLEYSHHGREFQSTLTRAKFEALTRDLLAHTQALTDHVREQAHLTWDKIARVLLVGGATRMPMVKNMLAELTGKTPDDRLDADQVVSRGAAIYAAIRAANDLRLEESLDSRVAEKLKAVEVRNVNAHSLGVQVRHPRLNRSVNAVLIPKNSLLPFARSRVFRIGRAGVTKVRVVVLQGDAEDASDCVTLGECLVSNLPPHLPAKSPVQVQLRFESNGRLSVTALESTAGVMAKAEIRRQGGLTEEDIRRESQFVQSLSIQ
jgi:molecular chaperone DnaK